MFSAWSFKERGLLFWIISLLHSLKLSGVGLMANCFIQFIFKFLFQVSVKYFFMVRVLFLSNYVLAMKIIDLTVVFADNRFES